MIGGISETFARSDMSDSSRIDKKKKISLRTELLADGKIHLSRGTKVPLAVSRSGPFSSSHSVFISLDGKPIRLEVSRARTNFGLIYNDGVFYLTRHGTIVAEVEPLRAKYHAPQHLFLNLSARCRYNCSFCRLSGSDLAWEKALKMIRMAVDEGEVESVAITSGIHPDEDHIVRLIARVARRVKKEFDIPFGAETCITSREQVEILRSSGVDEIKINLQTATDEIFNQICPDLDRPLIFRAISWATEIFGSNRVTGNVILGLGESLNDVRHAVESMAFMGAVPTLRPLKGISHDPYHLMATATASKEVLGSFGLDPRRFRTMCLACGACDLVPFVDV